MPFEEDKYDDSEEVIIIEDYDSMHEKIREISYFHFIFTNNNKQFPEIDDDFKVTKKFKDELNNLLPLKESDLIFKGYIKESYVGNFIKAEEFSSLIKDLSIRVCTNVLQELSKKEIVDVVWDESIANFAFQISPQHINSNIKNPKQFLKHVYGLAKKHLNLKDHSRSIRKKKWDL